MKDSEEMMTTERITPKWDKSVIPDLIDLPQFGCIPNTTLVMGRSGTGKTTLTIDRILASLQKGMEPNDILIISASALRAQDIKLALEGKLAGSSALPSILTTRQIALNILADKEAIKYTGRYPRLLADFEMSFLLEDLKVLGVRPGRIKEILKFFYRGWTELADYDPDWLITVEEKELHRLLKNELVYLQGMLEPELSNTAVRWLIARSDNSVEWRYSEVYVDDYQLLSRASQFLVNLLASNTLMVTGDEESILEEFESYPFVAGMEEFLRINPHTKRIDLTDCYQSKEFVNARNSLLHEDAFHKLPQLSSVLEIEPGSDVISSLSFTNPIEEFRGVANLVEILLDSSNKPNDIAIVVFNRNWASQIEAALRQSDIPIESHYGGLRMNSDIRNLDKSKAIRTYSALRLIADPADDFSWRCWCGFGDYLTNSSVFAAIKEYVASKCSLVDVDENLGLCSVLKHFDESGDYSLHGIEKMLNLYREGQALITDCQGLTAARALKRITEHITNGAEDIPSQMLRIPGWDTQGLSVSQLVSLYERYLFFPQLNNPLDSVVVFNPTSLGGKHFRTLLVCGFVNGFFPTRDYFDRTVTTMEKQAKIRTNDLRIISQLLGCVKEKLILTRFEKCNLVNAESLKLSVKRIRIEGGERICLIPQSELIDYIML